MAGDNPDIPWSLFNLLSARSLLETSDASAEVAEALAGAPEAASHAREAQRILSAALGPEHSLAQRAAALLQHQ